MKRLIALLLMYATIFTAAACGNAPAGNTVDTAQNSGDTTETPIEETEFSRESVDDGLGARNLGGYEFRIATCNSLTNHYFMEESSGDVVDDAIFKRNNTVEERFNCKIKVINDSGHRETGIITNTVTAGEDAIDLVCWHVVVLGQIAPSGYFMNWYDIPYVDFSKPWWSDSNVNDLTYNGVCVTAIGDFILSAIGKTYCVLYNKKLGDDYKLPNMYEVVNDGKWTFDYLVSLSKDIYVDLNNNGETDNDDLYGFTSDCKSNVCAYLWAFDNPVYKKVSDKMEFSLNLEKTADIVTKIMDAFSTHSGIRMDKNYTNVDGAFQHMYGRDMFARGLSVFANATIGDSLGYLRDLKDDYAILPYPKWDENQAKYYTMVDGSHQVMAVPITVTDTERIGVITEALCAESYKKVVPAYYDVALKFKGTRDEESIAMLDMIINSRVFDFAYVYDAWAGASFIIQNLIEQNNPNVASYWAKNEKAIMAHYSKVIEYFENFYNK